MTSRLRVLVEQPTRGKRWVAVAADWPGLERGGKTEDEAIEKLARCVPRYLSVAKRARLGSELATQTALEIIGRYPGVGSTDFWGISFAPSPLDRGPFDAPTFDRQVRLLRAAWAEFDEAAAGVSAELRPGVRGGGRSRDQIVRHVLATEGGRLLEAREGEVRAGGSVDAGWARPPPRPLCRGDARLVRGGQAARQLDDPLPVAPHGVPRAGSRVGDAGS
jgi:hypothetical protein